MKKFRDFKLAPTATLDTKTVKLIAAALLLGAGSKIVSSIALSVFKPHNVDPQSIAVGTKTTEAIGQEYGFIQESQRLGRAANMKMKEASGRPLLAAFMATLQNVLHVQFPSKEFLWDMEYQILDTHAPGQNPASDVAVLLLHSKGMIRPLLLYEYKPIVDLRPMDVNERWLLQALHKAYYCLHENKIPSCIVCLTDLEAWHYIKVSQTRSLSSPLIQIKWSKLVVYDNSKPPLPQSSQPLWQILPPSTQEFTRHVEFIITAVSQLL